MTSFTTRRIATERTDFIWFNRTVHVCKAVMGAVAMAAIMKRRPYSLPRATAFSAVCMAVPLGVRFTEEGCRQIQNGHGTQWYSVSDTAWGFAGGAQLAALVAAFKCSTNGDFKALSTLGKSGVALGLGLSSLEFAVVKAYCGIVEKESYRA